MRDCLFCLRESKVLVLKFHSNHSRLAGPVGKALAFETKMLTFRVQVPLEPTNFCRSNLLFFGLGRTYFGHITVTWHEIYIFMQIDFGFEFEINVYQSTYTNTGLNVEYQVNSGHFDNVLVTF